MTGLIMTMRTDKHQKWQAFTAKCDNQTKKSSQNLEEQLKLKFLPEDFDAKAI